MNSENPEKTMPTEAGDHARGDWMSPPCVVVMVGASGSGKSTWSKARWPATSVLSSDELRVLLVDNENAQWANTQVFKVLEVAARARLELGRRVIVDATNARKEDRAQWRALAREFDVPCAAVWFDIGQEECEARQQTRERKVSARVISRQLEDLEGVSEQLTAEDWDMIWRVDSAHAPGEHAVIKAYQEPDVRPAGTMGVRLGAKRCDIVGDVHGCYDELMALLDKLGWQPDGKLHVHPEDRLLLFVGDLVDRGPASVPVLAYVDAMIEAKRAFLVRGNHDDKLRRYLLGNKVKVDAHLQTTVDELEALAQDERQRITERAIAMIEASPYWALVGSTEEHRADTEATLVIAHAAFKPSLMQSKEDKVRWFCMYGPTTGKKDARGYPERVDWTLRYPTSGALCVTGHTPFSGAVEERNNTMCLDTACVFGHRLTALRWPEMEIVEIEAARDYTGDSNRVEERPTLVTPSR